MTTSTNSTLINPINRAFLYGDSVQVSFFLRNGHLIMAEECYFYLMASMRKMRMAIPLSYTLDFFQDLCAQFMQEKGIQTGILRFFAYRGSGDPLLSKSEVFFHLDVDQNIDALAIQRDYEIDLLKEISINTNLLSGIRVPCAENIYGEIYAAENELDDIIFLNPAKRIARTTQGNLLFLEGDTIKIPKTTEGAYISPLLENFVTFIHKNNLAKIEESEMIAFESQKADEILMISDTKGIFPVTKIRNKTFEKIRFIDFISRWQLSFS